MATKTETKRLGLRRETLRDLNAAELQQVIGGSYSCTMTSQGPSAAGGGGTTIR
jgi:hypothetical protein